MKAAIFDLDGTLLDSMHAWKDVGKIYLSSKGIKYQKNIGETIKTMSLRAACAYFKSEFNLNHSVEAIMDECNDVVKQKYFNDLELKPFAKKYLAQLKNQGIRMCIATATDKILAEAALKRLGIENYFEFIITDEDVGVGKKNPKIYLEAAKRFGVDREQCVVFEDAYHAIMTAKKAGFVVWGVYDTSEASKKEKIIKVCDYFIESYAAFLKEESNDA